MESIGIIMSRKEQVDKLIAYLKKYKKEESIETYREETFILDVLFGLACVIDEECHDNSAFKKFIRDKIETLPELNDADIRTAIANKDW